ncbi:hypothetical protein GCL60_12495 [Silvanigrella paludirubra]|uniref:YbgF trimerisation domain-containing protein n=1 Tax=Silvanigrella paludirubra TaxID=2499159 RepID=A0A6N6VQZ1_9BACT|nr:hypothetical protein [Silvanigrella paludirubra]KAB8037984.1 hypothetical protein GCL60_12495 [Silvanigrella paludirubra]
MKYLLKFILPTFAIIPCSVFANNESLTSQINELEDDIYTLQSEVVTYTNRSKMKIDLENQKEKTLKDLDIKIKEIFANQKKIEEILKTLPINLNKSKNM